MTIGQAMAQGYVPVYYPQPGKMDLPIPLKMDIRIVSLGLLKQGSIEV